MIRRYVVFVLLFLLAVSGLATAQSTGSPKQAQPSKPAPATPGPSTGKKGKQQMYGLGDQMFLVNAGLFAPLFLQDPSSGAISDPQLSAGAAASLEVDVYLNNNLSVGAEFGGAFSVGVNKQLLFLVPITAKVAWTFHLYPFDFPIYFGAGANVMVLNSQVYVGPLLRPGAAGYWNLTSKWSLGLRAEYWWIPESYFRSNPPASRTRFGNFLVLSLSALYHF